MCRWFIPQCVQRVRGERVCYGKAGLWLRATSSPFYGKWKGMSEGRQKVETFSLCQSGGGGGCESVWWKPVTLPTLTRLCKRFLRDSLPQCKNFLFFVLFTQTVLVIFSRKSLIGISVKPNFNYLNKYGLERKFPAIVQNANYNRWYICAYKSITRRYILSIMLIFIYFIHVFVRI